MSSFELWILIIFITSASGHVTATKYLNTSGDIMIGALFPIHNKGQGPTECGKVQVLDTCLTYSLEMIKNSGKFLVTYTQTFLEL